MRSSLRTWTWETSPAPSSFEAGSPSWLIIVPGGRRRGLA